MTEPEWFRQSGLRCEFCGEPGHYIAIALPVSLQFSADVPDARPSFEKRVTCPEHRFLVINRAERQLDEQDFAEHRHGRPVLGAEPYPERTRRAIRTIFDRLGFKVDGPDA